jgi:hypothetical protein
MKINVFSKERTHLPSSRSSALGFRSSKMFELEWSPFDLTEFEWSPFVSTEFKWSGRKKLNFLMLHPSADSRAFVRSLLAWYLDPSRPINDSRSFNSKVFGIRIDTGTTIGLGVTYKRNVYLSLSLLLGEIKWDRQVGYSEVFFYNYNCK